MPLALKPSHVNSVFVMPLGRKPLARIRRDPCPSGTSNKHHLAVTQVQGLAGMVDDVSTLTRRVYLLFFNLDWLDINDF